MGATNGLALPIPELTEMADGPDAISDLANAVEDYFYDRILPSGVTVPRLPSHNWGSVTTLPTTGAKIGDTCFHTGLQSHMICHAVGGGTWRQLRPALLATEAARLAISSDGSLAALLHQGFTVEEASTGARAIWGAGTDGWSVWDSKWQAFDLAVSVNPTAPFPEITYGNALRAGRYKREGRKVELWGLFQLGSTTTYGGQNGPLRIDYPTGLRPLLGTGNLGRVSGVCQAFGAFGAAIGAVHHEVNAVDVNRRIYFMYPTNQAALGGGGNATWNLTAANHYVQFTTSYEI